MKKLIIILLLALVGSGVWLLLHRDRSHHDISIGYIGSTNDVDFGTVAVFSITNHSDKPVRYNVSSLDFKTATGWTSSAPATLGGFGDIVVSGSGSMVWRIPPPKSAGIWRLTLSCVEGSQGNGRHYSIVTPEVAP
jgi:hypothetical protein